MTLLALKLGVGNFSDAEKRDTKASLDTNQITKTLKRNDYSCRFCGFRSEKHQRVIPYLDEPNAAKFVTVCSFCEQVIDLEKGGATGVGALIWLPEIDQATLNHIVRAIYVARAAEDPLAKTANQALDSLTTRRSEAKKRLGSDDPLLLATVMCESLTKNEHKKALSKIEGIRLLPADKYLLRSAKGEVNYFGTLLEYWCSEQGPFAKFPVDSWVQDLTKAVEKVGQS